jgi:hypothetical protein
MIENHSTGNINNVPVPDLPEDVAWYTDQDILRLTQDRSGLRPGGSNCHQALSRPSREVNGPDGFRWVACLARWPDGAEKMVKKKMGLAEG